MLVKQILLKWQLGAHAGRVQATNQINWLVQWFSFDTDYWSLFYFLCPTDSNFVLGNAQVQSLYPIVYCSDGFCELTGYARAELMQKSCACHFLYGPETSDRLTAQIQGALDDRREFKTELVFYKKEGKVQLCVSKCTQDADYNCNIDRRRN